MPHPWVYSATVTGTNISFNVEVTDLKNTQGVDTAGGIEITGEATQVNGAFAPISCITDIANATPGDPSDPEQAGRFFVNVEATPTPDQSFDPNEDVTVFVRLSKVWVTVLEPGTDETAQPRSGTPPTWGKHKADAHINGKGGY